MRKLLMCMCILCLGHAASDDLKIAVGAGYKKPVLEVLLLP